MQIFRIHDLHPTSVLAFDLRDILAAIGPRAAHRGWAGGLPVSVARECGVLFPFYASFRLRPMSAVPISIGAPQ